ncbi:phosphorylase superfamily protein [Paraphaeosphaeria sporulosa]
MRLLEIRPDGTLSLTKDFMKDEEVPAYAILSHTWVAGKEVTFDEFTAGVGHEAGYNKIRFCARQAEHDGLRYFWVDTCCINKADTVELQHAINSMFRWYRKAARCYVFLSDVPTADLETPTGKQALRKSRWFTRGWTLQELLAPPLVNFFSKDGKLLGTRHELRQEIHEITSIPVAALTGASLDSFSIDDRLSWSERRCTTRAEDMAYCLLGIFGVFTYLNYGEGLDNAFRRLKKAIAEDLRESSQILEPTAYQGGRSTFDTLGTRKAHYHIPFPKNRYFVGRKEELGLLNQKLLVDRNCQKMSIVGLGGMGKTQIALQFAYDVKESMSAVSIFWVPAMSMESFEQACASIVTALKIGQVGAGEDDAKEVLREYLSSDRAARWLLVLDNTDDPDLVFGTEQASGILDYLPESEKGITLFTTRTHEVAVSLTRGDVLELGSMSRGDATEFLQKSVINGSLVQDSEAAGELLDELACLPLAIAQAASYLNMNRTTIVKYLHLIRSTEQDLVSLMSKEFRDHTRYKGSTNAIASTWVVSFKQLRERDPMAAELLEFMSCVEWKAIPRSLLPQVQPEEQMEQAIGTLRGYSFVSRRDDGILEGAEGKEEWYDLHRLVHLATRIWVLQYGDIARVTERATKHVAEVFPTDDFANRAVWRAYMPHALSLLVMKHSCNVEDRDCLILWVGRCLHFDGRIGEAIIWLEECCRLREVLAEDHPDRLASQHELAGAYEANGQVKEAVTLLENVVAIRTEALAEDHRDRLASQHALAMAYRANGQVKKAVKLLENVVAIREEALAEDHPSRLASQHELARAYQANGLIKEAVKLLENVVAIRTEALAKDHPNRLASQHELAIAYVANGQVKEAVKLLENVVAIHAEALAKDHPNRLASQHTLAGAYQADGQVKEAVKLLENVVAIQEEALAEDHPSRLASQRTLAIAYEANGQVKEAVTLLENVVAIRTEALAEDHPDRLSSQHALAIVYVANGQVEEAVKLLENVVAIQAEALAEDHPDRLASQHALAIVYHANGQVKEAVKLLENVVAIRAEALAGDHPSRLASQHELARAYRANGQVKEAVKLLENVVAIQAEALAEDHPSRLASQHALAGAYVANGQVKEAVKLLENVVAIQEEKALAEDHPDRLASQHELAGAYQANGQVKEAVKLLENVVLIRTEALAEDHPDRLASQHTLAIAYQANGQVEEAVKLLENVVAIRTEALAEDHPDRLASQHALAIVYHANGQVKEAVKLLENVAAIRAEALAEDHPDQLASIEALKYVRRAE